jgi:hypothetical protein
MNTTPYKAKSKNEPEKIHRAEELALEGKQKKLSLPLKQGSGEEPASHTGVFPPHSMVNSK